METPIGIYGAKSPEGFHHSLLAGLSVIHPLQHQLALREYLLNIPLRGFVMGTEISFVIGSHRAKALPVFLRMHQNRMILGTAKVQNRLLHLIFHLNQRERLIHTPLVPSGNDGYRVPHIAHPAVQKQTVIGTGLRVSLACQGKPALPLGNILPGVNRLDPRNLHGNVLIHTLYKGAGMGRAKELYHQALPGRNVVRVNRLPCKKLHGVFFSDWFSHCFHINHRSPFSTAGMPVSPEAALRIRNTGTDFLPDTP